MQIIIATLFIILPCVMLIRICFNINKLNSCKKIVAECIRIDQDKSGWYTPVYKGFMNDKLVEIVSPESYPCCIVDVGDIDVLRVDPKGKCLGYDDISDTIFSVLGMIVIVIFGIFILLR